MDEIENGKLERYENYLSMPFGFQSIIDYSHGSKRCNIQAITYNSKTNEYIILDSRGISSWLKTFNQSSIKRILQFESYKFNVLRDIQYCRSYNIYFGLTKKYQLKIYNLNFHETFSIESDGASILCLIYNTQTDELITAGRSKLQFWKITSLNKNQSSQGLVLDREYNIANSALINNTYLDERLQRIYVIANYDISCYNAEDGRFVFNIKNASSSVLTVCAFSHLANVLVVGAVSGEISIFSSTGGKIATLVNHTKLITSIIMHPSDNNLFISSSHDGCIKLFSLQTLEEVFSISIFSEGVHWMKVHSLKYLYAASTKHIKILDLNYSFKFWSTLRSQIKNISINPKFSCKSSHAFIQATDHSIRIYQAKNGHKKCTVLPPPELNILNEIIWVTYDRIGGVVYMLFDDTNVWVYITKTDPATRVATWNVGKALQEKPEDENEENKFGKSTWSQKLEDQQVRCLCLCTIARSALKNVPDVPENMLNFSLLMCGLSNGTLVLLDPITNGSVHDSFKAHQNSPVLNIKIAQGNEYTHLYALLCTGENKFIRVFDVIHDFVILCDIFISPNTETYIYKNLIVVTGDSVGNLQIGRIQPTCSNQVKYLTENIEYKEHNGVITGLDVHCVKDIICSSADDNFIRVWNLEKILLVEIELEHSLASVAFLDKSLTILFGFKSHLFIIPDYILRSLKKKLCSSDDESTDENSEVESVIYEDIRIRKELYRSAYHRVTETNLSNYLVPYPYLGLEKLWLYTDTINRFYDKEESTKSEENEDEIYAITDDSLSCADTNLYQESLSRTSSRESIYEFPACVTSPEPDYIKSGSMNDFIENVPFVKASGINILEKEKKSVSSKVICVPVGENESESANSAQQPEARKINLFEKIAETPSQFKDLKSTISPKRFVERKIVKKVKKTQQNFNVKKREKESAPSSANEEIFNEENQSSKKEKNEVNIVKERETGGKRSTEKITRIQEKGKYKKDNFQTQPSKFKKAEPKFQNSNAQSTIRNTSKQQNLNEKKSILKTKVSKPTNHSNIEKSYQDHKQKKTSLVQLATGQYDRTISNSVRDVMSSLRGEKSNMLTSETKSFKDQQSPTTAVNVNDDVNKEVYQREVEQGQDQTDIDVDHKIYSIANEVESVNVGKKSGQFSKESSGYENDINKEIENEISNSYSSDRPKLLRRSNSEIVSKTKDDNGQETNVGTHPNQTLNGKLRSVHFPNSFDLSLISTPLRKSATADSQTKPENNSKEQQLNALVKKNRAEIIALRSLIRRNSISQSQVEGGSNSRFIDVCISKVSDINDQSGKEHPNKHKSEGLVRIAKKHSIELSDPTVLDISDDESSTHNTCIAQIPSPQIIRQEKNNNDIKTAKELNFPGGNHFHSDFSVHSHVMNFIVSAFKKPSPVSTLPPEAQSSSPINMKEEILPSEPWNSQAERLETVETIGSISKIEIHRNIDEVTTQGKASNFKLQQGSTLAVKAVSNMRKISSRRNWKAMRETSVKRKFSREFDVFITPRNSLSSVEYMPVSRVDTENSPSSLEEEETVQEDRHERLMRLTERNPVLYDKLIKHKRKLLKKKITGCEKQGRASKAILNFPNEIPVENYLTQQNHECRHVNSRNSARISSSPIRNQISNSHFPIQNQTPNTNSPIHVSSSGSSSYISATSSISHENDVDLAPRKINYAYEDQRIKNLQRIDILEKKLSGQKHRFHVQKSIDDIRNENFELHFLRNKVHGMNLLLPIEKLDVSIPQKSGNSFKEQIRVVSPSKSKRETSRVKVE